MKKTIIPDIGRIIKIIIICFITMLLVINFAKLSIPASLIGILLFFIFITPAFIIISKKYLKELEEAFCKNIKIPPPLIENPIALRYLKKQLQSTTNYRVIKSLRLLEDLKKPIPKKSYQKLILNKALVPYLISTLASNEKTIENILCYLDDDDIVLKKRTIESLIFYGTEAQKELAVSHLKTLISDVNPSLRIIGAKIIAKTKKTDLFEHIVNLLSDSNLNVRRLAIITAGKCGDESFIPHITKALKDKNMFYASCRALALLGIKTSFETINEAFKNIPQKHRTSFLKNISQIKADFITKLLVHNLNNTDFLTKRNAIGCLFAIGIKIDDETYPQIKSCLYELSNHAAWLLSAIGDISENLEANELKRVLKYEFDLTKESIFKLLPIIIPETKKLISFANDGKPGTLLCSSQEIAKLLPEEIKFICMPLIEHLSLHERSIRLKPYFGQTSTDFETRLIQIFTANPNKNLSLSRAHAVRVAGTTKKTIFFNHFEAALFDVSSLVRETTIWAINHSLS